MPYPLLLHAKHRGADVTYQAFGEWMVPWHFESTPREYETLRTGVGLLDYSMLALVEVQGADRINFLQNLLTNDIKRLEPGAGCPAALLDASGHLITDLLVFVEPEAVWLLCDATQAAAVTQTLERYVFSEQVSLTNHERRQAVLALQGPRTIECLIQLLGRVVSLPSAGDHVTASFQGLPARIIRHTLTGDVGALCLCDGAHAEPLWDLLASRGTAFGLRLVGWEALNIARIETGIPMYGIDMDHTNLLPETGLERVAVSATKGCYVGQEIIARMETQGSANKKLMALVLEGEESAVAGDRLVQGELEVGRITSACWSLGLNRPIAMGYVKRPAYEPGTMVDVLRADRRILARVSPRPFIPHK